MAGSVYHAVYQRLVALALRSTEAMALIYVRAHPCYTDDQTRINLLELVKPR